MEYHAEAVKMYDTYTGQPVVWEGPPRFFDAARLPDAPDMQDTVTQSCCIYVLFPSTELLKRGLTVLSLGERSGFGDHVRKCTIDALHPGKTGVSLLEQWEQRLSSNGKENNDGT